MRGIDLAVRPYPTAPGRPLVYAHRGASARAPENTVEAFSLAAELGADGIELDVMVCGTGEVVVCHDAWLGRLAGRELCVPATPFGVLRALDLAWHRPDWGKAARMPTLREVLEAVPTLRVNIELKDERFGDEGLAAKVAAIVAEQGAWERVVISSFNPVALLRMRRHAPRLPLAHLYEAGASRLRAVAPAVLVGVQAVHPEHTLITAQAMRRWQEAGFAVGAWTVDDPERAVALAGLGIRAIFTNRPAAIGAALRGAGFGDQLDRSRPAPTT